MEVAGAIERSLSSAKLDLRANPWGGRHGDVRHADRRLGRPVRAWRQRPVAHQRSPDDDLELVGGLRRVPRHVQIGRPDLGGRILARPSERGPDHRRASRTRARRDCSRRDCGPPRPGAERRVDRARLRLAEDRWPFDAGRRHSGRGARGGHRFSLATASRSGDGTGNAAAGRCLSGERAEPVRRQALAMAGARRVGRRSPPFLFLVDAQPDAVRSARHKGAGACDARALDRRAGAVPAASSLANGASASRPAFGADGCANACAGASAGGAGPCPCSLDGSTSDSFAGFASAASICFVRRGPGDGASTAGAGALDASTSDNSAGFASPGGASACRPDLAPGNRTDACNSGSCRSRNG